MKTIVIYYSKTGFTKKYVDWLKEDIECDVAKFEDAGSLNFDLYDVVILASNIRAEKVQKLDWFKKQNIKTNNKVVLVTGASPIDSSEIQKSVQNNFVDDLGKYKVFYLPSGLCYEKMGMSEKAMMKVFVKMMKNKKNKTKEEEEMAKAIGASYDNSDKKYLEPVIKYLKELEK